MIRHFNEKLKDWSQSKRRKPLILRGARQVGKTWLVENFAKANYSDFLKIDLEKKVNLREIFSRNLDPKEILSDLELITGHKITIGHTLLFIDEIQNCPQALVALRYFYEEMPELHIVAAGSLIEFALEEISFPVGRVQFMDIFPMNFSEFLIATNKELLADKLLDDPASVSTSVHNKLIDELKTYFVIGGMPECIQTFIDSGSIIQSFDVQSEILDSYQQDFSKYAKHSDHACLNNVLLNLSQKVGDQIKYTQLNTLHTGPTNHKAFDLLCKARLINKIPSCNPSGLPLGGSVNFKKFKASILDIGLMQRLCQLPIHSEIRQSDLLEIYRGRLAEQFVAQELSYSRNRELYYWSREARSSQAEVDFVTTQESKIIPIEVKSGKGGSLRSLHYMLKEYSNLKNGIVLNTNQYSVLPNQNLTFLPLYYAGQL